MNQHPPLSLYILEIARRAKQQGPEGLPPGHLIAAAFVLNRPEWLSLAGVQLAEAVDRLGPGWLAHIPEVARMLTREAAGGQGLEGRVSRDCVTSARRYEVDVDPDCPYRRLRLRCWAGAELEVQGQFPSDRGIEARDLGQQWIEGAQTEQIAQFLP